MAVSEDALQQLRHGLRPGQRSLADWRGGMLAVSAVPGAGKSTGMAVAAVIAIARAGLGRQRQLVVVTFTRSAGASINQKIREHLEYLRLPTNSFVVGTLHSLALQIALSHRSAVGIDFDNGVLISEAQKERLFKRTAVAWLRYHPRDYGYLLEGRGFDGDDGERLRRDTVLRTEVLPALARATVTTAKSGNLTPEDLRQVATPDAGMILGVAAGLYETYNELLRAEDAFDFDDMLLGALRALEHEDVRRQWQDRVYAVFEDEAQDSTPLQARLLEILADNGAGECHLVRVGDPNQAINASFTTSDPIFFRLFCDRCAQEGKLITLDQAGRSSPKIIKAANFILRWVNQRYASRFEIPFREQMIQPVPSNDPQRDANPSPIEPGVEVVLGDRLPDVVAEAQWIGARLRTILSHAPQTSVAILVRQRKQAQFLGQHLRSPMEAMDIHFYDVEQQERQSRVPMEMLTLLHFVASPHSPEYTKAALELLKERQVISTGQDLSQLSSAPEQFLFPTPAHPTPSKVTEHTQKVCCGLLQARMALPLEALIAFFALTLKYQAAELATADKLASQLQQALGGRRHLQRMLTELEAIVSQGTFAEIDDEASEARYCQPGQVTVVTLHKAKGLDWDVVFIPFLHERLFPGNPFQPQSVKFLGDYTLPEVARGQLRALIHNAPSIPDPKTAWEQGNWLKQAEEYRLLYVGMTRAKKLLCLTAAASAPYNWGNLKNCDDRANPCPAIAALAQNVTEL